jgi:hypothetical protein
MTRRCFVRPDLGRPTTNWGFLRGYLILLLRGSSEAASVIGQRNKVSRYYRPSNWSSRTRLITVWQETHRKRYQYRMFPADYQATSL